MVFETVEQAALLPLSPEPFDRPTWAQATVHPDHHIQFARALYSLPTAYIGKRVDVRGDWSASTIAAKSSRCIRRQPPGGRATDYTDYPAERAPYALRAPAACIRQAEGVGLLCDMKKRGNCDRDARHVAGGGFDGLR